jgi:PleD family two-component response regulator
MRICINLPTFIIAAQHGAINTEILFIIVHIVCHIHSWGNRSPRLLIAWFGYEISSSMYKEILLIDDDADEHELFSGALGTIGKFRFISAFGTDESLRVLKSSRPDLIFLDINMPAKNGFVCLQEIKQTPHLSDIPVQMYSTSANEKDVQRAMELGAKGYMVKAGSFTELCKNLRKVLKPELKEDSATQMETNN